ncbi:MAG: hypothetical protein ACJ78Q_05845 [Chloroflexia bacterium]
MTNQHNNPGYDTPGNDTIIKSTSPAVPSPSKTGQERLSPPDPAAVPRGETPGDANPALDETVGFEQGQTGTADLLRARETAEEEAVRARGDIHPYQDEGLGDAPDEFDRSDTGRPTWPDDRQENPIEYMESPRADSSLMAGSPDKLPGAGDLTMKGRTDMTVERGSTEAAARETRSGLPPTGFSAEEDEYERREMHTPSEPSDLDRIAPGMSNIPPEEDNEQR